MNRSSSSGPGGTAPYVRPAGSADLESVRALLAAAGLPAAGLEEFFGPAYAVAVDDRRAIVGAAGIEAHGAHGLLRSVVVSDALRGRGIGEALVLDRLAWAKEHGLVDIHLLTTTAAAWFERFGFVPARRDAAPEEIRASVEFASACPESAVAMSRPVPEPSADELREEIRARYASAARATRTGPSSCCGDSSGSSCCSSSAPEGLGTPAQLGYDVSDVAALPVEAVQASLGCGNPLLLAQLREGETVLDLGSGGGIDVLLSARRVGPAGHAYGVDMTGEMLALARENQRKAGVTNATFLEGAIEAIPLPEASVDVVISNCVLNLSTDKPRAIAEAFRVLRPGGRLAVADIVTTTPMPPAARRAAALWAGCVAGALPIDEYRRVLEVAGFTDVEIEPTHDLGREAAEDQGCCGTKSIAPELAAWDGQVLSAFVRATKPPVGSGRSRAGTDAMQAVPVGFNRGPSAARTVATP